MKSLETRRDLAGRLSLLAAIALGIAHAAAQVSSTDVRSPQAQLLTEARTYLNLESFDLADKRYRQVLALDPENEIALRGRSEVRDARERVKEDVADGRCSGTSAVKIPTEQNAIDAATVARKLQSITIPLLEIQDMSLDDVLEELRQDARKYDTDPVEEERGLNIFLRLPQPSLPAAGISGLPNSPPPVTTENMVNVPPLPTTQPANRKITLRLENVSLLQALNQTAGCAGLKIKVEPYAVSVVPLVESAEELITLEIRVPAAFLGVEEKPAPLLTNDSTGRSGPLTPRIHAKKFLESCGVTFPPGAAAVYLAATSKLVVRDTQANIDLVQALWEEFKNSPYPTTNP